MLNIVQPTNAYFGQKDAAQCVLIRRIVEDLDMDVNVIIKDTIRESDGLAMSSRNAYLTATERQAAPIVYKSLCIARELFQQEVESNGDNNGSVLASRLREVVESNLQTEPLVTEIQYVSVDSRTTMEELERVEKDVGAIISLACKIGSVRLIDNILLYKDWQS